MSWQRTLLLSAVTVLAPAVVAQQTYDLRSEYHVGQILVVSNTLDLSIDVPEPGIGGEDGMPAGKSHILKTSEVRVRVMEIKDGLPTLSRVVITRAALTQENPGEEAMHRSTPLVNKAILAKTVAGKQPIYTLATGNPGDVESASFWLTDDMGGKLARALNPRMAAMTIGDEIAATPEQAGVILGCEFAAQATFRVKLVEVTGPEGNPIARLDFTATVTGARPTEQSVDPRGHELGDPAAGGPGLTVAVAMTGKCLFSLARQHLDSIESEGKFHFVARDEDGHETGPAAEGPVTGRIVYTEAPGS